MKLPPHRLIGALLTTGLLVSVSCGTPPPHPAPDQQGNWSLVSPRGMEELAGIWWNPGTGHVVRFSESGREVFHLIDGFCIRDGDNGDRVVPEYSLYRLAADDELELLYHDYRDWPELLQAPFVFRALDELPEACRDPATSKDTMPAAELFALIVDAFREHYAFFDERSVDWDATVASVTPAADAIESYEQLFDLVSEMLAPLGDGHVNLTWEDRAFNAGRPRLRQRLGDAWKVSGSELAEGAWVGTWHRGVLDSVKPLLDTGSLRTGAAGAIEWATIDERVGYIRVNRFGGFTTEPLPRPDQYAQLEEALRLMRADLGSASSLIVDVALNGGGSDRAAQLVASYFADERRHMISYEGGAGSRQDVFISPNDTPETRPVFLLTSEVTASAAESFVLMMRAFPHVTHVGGATRGGISSLLPKPLPNGFRVTLSYQRVLDAQGQLFEGRGIAPQREIELFPDEDLHGTFARELARLTETLPR